MKYSDWIAGFLVNMIAGVILAYGLPVFDKQPSRVLILVVTMVIIALTSALFVVSRRVITLARAGVSEILPSMTDGRGSTQSILRTVNRDLSFMGIAGGKWVNVRQFEETIKAVGARHRTVRFLLLDPACAEAEKLSLTMHGNTSAVPQQITDSLRALNRFRLRGFKIEVRLYTFLPIFRIAIVDGTVAYVGFYRANVYGNDSPQLVLHRRRHINTYEQAFEEYFEEIWKNYSTEPDWALYSPMSQTDHVSPNVGHLTSASGGTNLT